MKLKLLLAAAALAVLVQPAVQAAPSDPIVYSGAITPSVIGNPVTGSTGAFSWLGMNDVPPLNGDLPPVQFWSFIWSFPAGTHATITGRRLNNNLDPVFSLYQGLITPGTTYNDFDPFGNFDSVTLIGGGDDEIDAPGPFGDPQFKGVLTAGVYTIAIGGFSSDCPLGVCPAGGFPYQLTVQVPEPATIPLMLIALGGIGWIARRQKAGGVSRLA